MTRWKKEINRKGFKLEKDFPMVPFNEILGVYPSITPDGISIATEYTFAISYATILRNGTVEFMEG